MGWARTFCHLNLISSATCERNHSIGLPKDQRQHHHNHKCCDSQPPKHWFVSKTFINQFLRVTAACSAALLGKEERARLILIENWPESRQKKGKWRILDEHARVLWSILTRFKHQMILTQQVFINPRRDLIEFRRNEVRSRGWRKKSDKRGIQSEKKNTLWKYKVSHVMFHRWQIKTTCRKQSIWIVMKKGLAKTFRNIH